MLAAPLTLHDVFQNLRPEMIVAIRATDVKRFLNFRERRVARRTAILLRQNRLKLVCGQKISVGHGAIRAYGKLGDTPVFENDVTLHRRGMRSAYVAKSRQIKIAHKHLFILF